MVLRTVLPLLATASLSAAVPSFYCGEERWLPEGTEYPDNPNCALYDGSLIPDCSWFLNNRTSYFHLHENDCGKFWECSPQGPCLFECPDCGGVPQCIAYGSNQLQERLSFDCRYQYPEGPVCSWPDSFECRNNWTTQTPPTPTNPPTPTTPPTTLDTTTKYPPTPAPECREDGDCTATVCSSCEAGECRDPECCSSDDCTEMVCSECLTEQTCSKPECCTDEDCLDTEMCEEQQCVPRPTTTTLDPNSCDVDRPCQGANEICQKPLPYDNCEYCDMDEKLCKPGCESDANCAEGQYCAGHICVENPRTNGVETITIKTETCVKCEGSGNPLGVVEGGLAVHLTGRFGTECSSRGLDNLEKVDYDNNVIAIFDGLPNDDDDDDGMGGCKLADLNYGLEGGRVTWTGPDGSTWTAQADKPVCIDFYDPDNVIPTCCCGLATKTLAKSEESELINCMCQ